MDLLSQNKNILLIALVVVLILLVPLVAMQFTEEVTWSAFDFALAGALLFGAGLAFELLTRRAGTRANRVALGLTLAAALLLLWVNLAVGVIGAEDNPVNLLYFGVLAVLFVGALLARWQPHGMARVLYATALAQAAAALIGLLLWGPDVSTPEALLGVLRVVGVNVFFVLLWVAAGRLYQRALSEG